MNEYQTPEPSCRRLGVKPRLRLIWWAIIDPNYPHNWKWRCLKAAFDFRKPKAAQC